MEIPIRGEHIIVLLEVNEEEIRSFRGRLLYKNILREN